jgi:hypothetical protein
MEVVGPSGEHQAVRFPVEVATTSLVICRMRAALAMPARRPVNWPDDLAGKRQVAAEPPAPRREEQAEAGEQ